MKALLWAQRNGLRIVAALALLALSGVMAAYNAEGWLARGLPLLAALAVITELLAFVMAVNAESAFRGGTWLKGLACVAVLIGCEAFNAMGSHTAWDADQAPKLEAERQHAQAALDGHRAALQMQIAGVALPDPSHGPQRQAIEQRTWEAATATSRRQLHALPLVAEVAPPFPAWIVWSFLAFIGFAKSFGLWAIGMSVGGRKAVIANNATTGNVVELDRSEIGRRMVGLRKDRQQATA